MSNAMSMDKVLAQLSSLKAHCVSFAKEDGADDIWQTDVDAVENAISMLSALQDEGINDLEQARDLIHDYHLQADELKRYRRKYDEPRKLLRKHSMYLCPDCENRIAPNHTHCHWCRKKLGGW